MEKKNWRKPIVSRLSFVPDLLTTLKWHREIFYGVFFSSSEDSNPARYLVCSNSVRIYEDSRTENAKATPRVTIEQLLSYSTLWVLWGAINCVSQKKFREHRIRAINEGGGRQQPPLATFYIIFDAKQDSAHNGTTIARLATPPI